MPTKDPPPQVRDPVTARVLPNWRVWRADDTALLSGTYLLTLREITTLI